MKAGDRAGDRSHHPSAQWQAGENGVKEPLSRHGSMRASTPTHRTRRGGCPHPPGSLLAASRHGSMGTSTPTHCTCRGGLNIRPWHPRFLQGFRRTMVPSRAHIQCATTSRPAGNTAKPASGCLPVLGDPYGNRTHVTAVKGRCLNRLTNGPNGSGNLTRTDDTPGMNRMLYQLSYAAMWVSS